MKPLVAGVGLLIVAAVCAQSQSVENPNFRIEIQAGAQGGPKFIVTNLSGKTVSACVLEISLAAETKGQSKVVWDARY